MSDLSWIAALLSPGDVAPHPNFMSTETLTPSGLLALLIQGRFVDFQRLIDPTLDSSLPKYLLDDSQMDHVLLRACVSSMEMGTQRLGADVLAALAADQRIDAAARTAAVLLASVAYGELDEIVRATELLKSHLDGLQTIEHADARFLEAVTGQQLSMRYRERGLDDDGLAVATLRLWRRLNPRALTAFSTSEGIRRSSTATLREIREQAMQAAEANVMNSTPERQFTGWERLVRRGASQLALRTAANNEPAYWAHLEGEFERLVNSGTMTFASGDPVDSPLYAALLHYELLGDWSAARRWRTRLSIMRFLRASTDEGMVRETLRLARQAEDERVLEGALRAVRIRGPLRSLRDEALQVISTRATPGLLRVSELMLLEAAAAVLTAPEASGAFDAVVAALEEGLPGTHRKWQLYGVRAEKAWLAVVELGASCSRLSDAAALLLRASEREGLDTVYEQGLRRALARIDWDEVDGDVRDAWSARLRRSNDSTSVAIRHLIGPDLDLESQSPSTDLRLGEVAELLNRTIRGGHHPSSQTVAMAAAVVRGQLESTRRDAAHGSFGFGGIPVAELAAGICLHWHHSGLWGPLAEFITDRFVNPSDKAHALERLSVINASPPADFVTVVGQELSTLLRPLALNPLERDNSRAAALRFGIRHGVLSEPMILTEISSLLGSSDVNDRMEAARCFALLGQVPPHPDWATVISYQLAHDRDVEVRAEAGRALGILTSSVSPMSPLLEAALLDLLGSDGLLVPLLTLRGLLASGDPTIPGAVWRRVEALRDSHLAFGVRLQAQALLDRLG